MTHEELKASALRNILEEHLWNYGESTAFTLSGPNGTIDYRIVKTVYGWKVMHKLSRVDVWHEEGFPTMGKAYHFIFRGLNIAY